MLKRLVFGKRFETFSQRLTEMFKHMCNCVISAKHRVKRVPALLKRLFKSSEIMFEDMVKGFKRLP